MFNVNNQSGKTNNPDKFNKVNKTSRAPSNKKSFQIIKDKFTHTDLSEDNDNYGASILSLNVMEVPSSSYISDSRLLGEFKTHTFSGPPKSQVSSVMDKCIAEEKLEAANYWAFQLLLSGISLPLWNKLLTVAVKQINIANPHLPTFLLNRTVKWDKISKYQTYQKSGVLNIRNNQEIRNLLIELVSLLTLSRKRKMESIPKLKMEDFAVKIFKTKLEARNTDDINHILKEEDPSEIRIAANEFLYQLQKKNINKTLYWLGWMLEWEKINIKKYKIYKVGDRYKDGIDGKFSSLLVWLVWDIIEFVKKGDFELGFDANQELNSLWELYKHDFSLGARNRKLIFITWSIKILTSKIDWKLKLIEREELFFHAISNVNLMIQKIKPDEINKGIYQDQKFKIMIQNNYLSPEKKNQMIDEERRKIMEKQKQNRIKEAKKKKISINSLDKLEQLKKMDKYINF
jgi:hypothetical protein